MIFTRRYNLVNNALGWGVFLIALLTYWFTLEPSASYWDCGEFIIQADKLEIGHPPGNPIFMLTARFFANFAFGNQQMVALMVNAMSGLLSALTILLLFWTVTHLVRRLVMSGDRESGDEPSLTQYLVIMGSGICGALAYAWSDTFWFSAVEGEVYAFSSFCTALVFWLILKWENRADQPHSDRYLVLIAYVIGVSIAVHLLNLLCIPAIVLVYCYRRFPGMNVSKSLLALLISFALIVIVLYGLVPGFIEMAGYFELMFVNGMGLPFNAGTLIYALLTVGVLLWCLYELYAQRSGALVRISVAAGVALSGMLLIGSGVWIGIILFLVLCYFLWVCWGKRLPMRWLNLAMWSVFVIFVGYSSYALIIIRSSADSPMNQNAPNNTFALSSYLNREQYGQVPLLYGETFESAPQQELTQDGRMRTRINKGKPEYARGVKNAEVSSPEGFLTPDQIADNQKLAARGKDYYALYDYASEYVMNPELNMFMPRIHSSAPGHAQMYALWVPGLMEESDQVVVHGYDAATGNTDVNVGPQDYNENGEIYNTEKTAHKPTFGQNLAFFFNYQLNHMYWRYFLWNFAGRQNDINNQYGEKDAGNWITGIPMLDNPRLGDQSLLPPEYGSENAGHNVYYLLPLILGIIGLLWQAFRGRRGIEQFWVVFFLFFMTGIAIVLYLNQPPLQPRERDYAFAGSFYAFAIWIGMGVAALHAFILWAVQKSRQPKGDTKDDVAQKAEAAEVAAVKPAMSRVAAWIAVAIGILVPIQMVSQTWDDHDRSGRYAAPDFAKNYLNSLEPNAIIFCNGDNDTFPLWYAQEVEGVRPDVKIINLSYLASDWYANQMRHQTYTAAPVEFTATPADYAYDRRNVVYETMKTNPNEPMPLVEALKEIYSDKGFDADYSVPAILHSNTYIPVDSAAVAARGLLPKGQAPLSEIPVKLSTMSLGQLLMLDIIATSAQNGWKRPIYWAITVGDDNYRQFAPYLRQVGMALQLVPYQAGLKTDAEKAYGNIMNRFLWGGADNPNSVPYFDETAGRMLSFTRMVTLDLAQVLADQGRYKTALEVLNRFDQKLGPWTRPLSFNDVYSLGSIYCMCGQALKDPKALNRGLEVLSDALKRYAVNVRYADYMGQRFGMHEAVDEKAGTSTIQIDVMLTPENAAILYQYEALVEAYTQFAGAQRTSALLRQCGISQKLEQRLQQYYNYATVPGAAPSANQSGGDYAAELAKYAEVVVEMQSKSPDEYAQASADEQLIDSVFALMLKEYLDQGGKQEELMKYPIFDKVDGERSVRLGNAYAAAHPE